MKFRLTLFHLLVVCSVYSQEIPDIDWTKAGNVLTPDIVIDKVDFVEFKSSFSEALTDDECVQLIIDKNAEGVTIHFDKGEYFFKEQIRLASNVSLIGEGEETVFNFDLDDEQDCILAQGKKTDISLKLDASVAKGTNILPVLIDEEFHAGDYIYLVDQDEELVESSWAEGKTGQLFQIWVKSDKYIKVNGGHTRRDYILEWVPSIYKIEPVENVKIEKLKIVNHKATTGQTSNIHFSYVVNAVIGGVTSEMGNYSHVLLEYSSNCEIMGCDFWNAHDFGNGGKGYGVTLQFASCNNIVIGNHFKRLRHSMLLQAGANGNVLYHNTSTDPYWTDVRLPEDAAGDIVLHGNYVYANLIENNDVQNIVVDNTHGMNGPDNFFYNNRISGYGIYIHRKSPRQVVIKNEIKKSKWPKGRYRVRGKQFENDNKVGNKRKPRKSEEIYLKESYWL